MHRILITGGLTVDRFADGSTAPGGSVLHAGLAATADGAEATFLTLAGPEVEARRGIERLSSMGTVVCADAPRTTTYRHEERDGRRVLVLESPGGRILPEEAGALPDSVDVALFAPIADELSPDAVDAVGAATRARLTVHLIQGWLRRLSPGAPVQPLPLHRVDRALWSTLSQAHAVVLSTEDLAETQADPFLQAADLRARIGSRPLLVLTLGTEGYLLDDPATPHVTATMPRRVVEGVPAVGAGDTFGAVLALRLAAGDSPVEAAHAASDRVIAVLESRR